MAIAATHSIATKPCSEGTLRPQRMSALAMCRRAQSHAPVGKKRGEPRTQRDPSRRNDAIAVARTRQLVDAYRRSARDGSHDVVRAGGAVANRRSHRNTGAYAFVESVAHRASLVEIYEQIRNEHEQQQRERRRDDVLDCGETALVESAHAQWMRASRNDL